MAIDPFFDPQVTMDKSTSNLEEPLLRSDDSEESLDRIPRKRSAISTLLGVPAYVYWLIILVQFLVILKGRLGNGNEIASSVPYTPLYSPALEAVEYVNRTFYSSFPDDRSEYQIPLSPELDKKWEDLYNHVGAIRIPKNQADLLPNKTVRIPGDEDHYIITLDVFHQLNCLNLIRRTFYPIHYPNYSLERNPHALPHVEHCIDTIRQALMCSADVSPQVWRWNETTQESGLRMDVAHTCRNFEKIQDWARNNSMVQHFNSSIHVP